EIAHVILRHDAVVSVVDMAAPSGLTTDVEELLCDRIAARLLLPDHWIARMKGHPFRLRTLVALAHSAQVSNAMLTTRLATEGVPVAFIRWKRAPTGQWLAHGRAGTVGWIRGALTPSSATMLAFASADNNPSPATITLLSGRRQIMVRAELQR